MVLNNVMAIIYMFSTLLLPLHLSFKGGEKFFLVRALTAVILPLSNGGHGLLPNSF